MDQLVSMITEKTGLPADKAREVIGMVVNFISDKLPAPIAGQVRGLVEGGGDAAAGAADAAGGLMDKAKDGLGGLLGG